MLKHSSPIQKRLPVTLAALLAGVTLTGVIASVMATPKGSNNYLHEHLSAAQIDNSVQWDAGVNMYLPAQDQDKITQIIARTERLNFAQALNDKLTGQALEQTRQTTCHPKRERCPVSIRLNRHLKATHINADMRVINVKETSLRINFETDTNRHDVDLDSLANETRLLRFYQTQGGWMQNAAEIMDASAPVFSHRKDKFRAAFSKQFTGLNYYPAAASWKAFWMDFPTADIKHDLETAQGLGVNSLRIFLNHDYFDAEETRAEALAKLQTFLDICAAQDIDVLITLFDLRPNYTLSNWTADIAHIDRVFPAIGAHEAVLGIDIKNQPDLDFKNWGEGLVQAWLTVMARHIQTQYPDLPVTIGWSKSAHALRLKDVVDVVTYHEYQNPDGLEQRLKNVIIAVDDKPVMITELGSTTWTPPFTRRRSETVQASRLQNQLAQARRATGIFVWTLNDFEHVSRDVVGPLPWRRLQQKHFGLYRADGSPRPAAQVLKTYSARQNLEYSPSTLSPSNPK